MASTHQFEIEAEVRHDKGKGASRRLRRQNNVPGVIYGGGKEAVSLSLSQKALLKALETEAFYSHILSLKINGNVEQVILKALQRHPYQPKLLHIDFQRVRANEKIHMHIPLHFIGGEKAPGVDQDGGIISHIISDVEISCLPGDLPEFINVDLSNMKLNDIIHLSDLKLPKGIELVALSHNNDQAVASLHLPRIEEEPEITEEVAPGDVPAIEQSAEESETETKPNEKGKETK